MTHTNNENCSTTKISQSNMVDLCYMLKFNGKILNFISSGVFLCTLATSSQAVAPPTRVNHSLIHQPSTSTTFMSSSWALLTPPSWLSSSGGHPCSLSSTTGTVRSYATPILHYLVERGKILLSELMPFPKAVNLLTIKKRRSLGIPMG